MIFHTAGKKEKKIFIMNNEKKNFDAVGWKSYCNTKKNMLYCGAGRAGAGCAAGRWVRGRALGARQGAGRAAGRWARGRQALGTRQVGAKRAAGRRWARAAWAPGLALGSALDALGPFSIRFDSFFFPESPNEHRSL